jgi:hypothetical protein
MRRVVNALMRCVQPAMLEQGAGNGATRNSFELWGVDFMIGSIGSNSNSGHDGCRPWLIEV